MVESGARSIVDPDRVKIMLPARLRDAAGGLHIRWPDGILEQEARLLDYKGYAALAYVRANGLDRIVWDSPSARLGIITTGKAYGDMMQALADLGIDEDLAAHRPARLQGGAVLAARAAGRAPLRRGPGGDPGGRGEAPGHRVPDQGRALQLAGRRAPPHVVGKFDDSGEWSRSGGQPAGTWLLPAHYEQSPAMVAHAIAQRLKKLGMTGVVGRQFRERLAFLDFKEKAAGEARA